MFKIEVHRVSVYVMPLIYVCMGVHMSSKSRSDEGVTVPAQRTTIITICNKAEKYPK